MNETLEAVRRQNTSQETRPEQLSELPGPQRSDRTVRHSAVCDIGVDSATVSFFCRVALKEEEEEAEEEREKKRETACDRLSASFDLAISPFQSVCEFVGVLLFLSQVCQRLRSLSSLCRSK